MPQLAPYFDYTHEEVREIFLPKPPYTPQGGTWGLQGIVTIPDTPGDFVFFVTFAQEQGDHVFEEGITTIGSINTDFLLSANELEFSRRSSENYALYRPYEYDPRRSSGVFYILPDHVGDHFRLTPIQFRVTPKQSSAIYI